MPENSAQNTLLELEEQRKAIAKTRVNSCFIIAAGVLVVLSFVLSGAWVFEGSVGGAVIAVGGIIYFFSVGNKLADYTLSFKQRVVYAAMQELDPNMRIEPGQGFSESEFTRSGLFDQEPERMHSEDQITGMVGATSFRFSEVHAEYKTVTQTKNGRTEHWHDIFKGVIFTAEFNKNFLGFTVVRPRSMSNAIGAWFARNVPLLSPGSDELVRLENPDFCEEFVTYSTDQVEARYILTPAMMERLCELNARSEDTISVSFNHNILYLAFPLDNNHFEPPLFKTLLNPDLLKDDIELIRFMYGIIEDLDLNTKIWGRK